MDKNENENENENDNENKNNGIIYLIQPTELIGTDRFKIGFSGMPTLKRCITGYKTGSRYLCIMECIDPAKIEQILIKKFCLNFKLVAGNEYFEGDEIKIVKMFIDNVISYKYDIDNYLKQNKDIIMNKKKRLIKILTKIENDKENKEQELLKKEEILNNKEKLLKNKKKIITKKNKQLVQKEEDVLTMEKIYKNRKKINKIDKLIKIIDTEHNVKNNDSIKNKLITEIEFNTENTDEIKNIISEIENKKDDNSTCSLYECKFCDYENKHRKNFLQHCMTKNHIYKESAHKFCYLCKKSYISIITYKKHKKYMHNMIINS